MEQVIEFLSEYGMIVMVVLFVLDKIAAITPWPYDDIIVTALKAVVGTVKPDLRPVKSAYKITKKVGDASGQSKLRKHK